MKKKSILFLAIFFAALLLGGCHSKSQSPDSLFNGNKSESSEAFSQLEESQSLLEDVSLAIRHFNMGNSEEDFKKLAGYLDKLHFEYDKDDVSKEERHQFAEQQFMVDSMKMVVEKLLNERVVNFHKSLVTKEDHLLTGKEEDAVYLCRGDKLFIDFSTPGNVVVKIYNADSHATLKSYVNKKSVHDSLKIANSAVYLVEMSPKGNPYVELSLSKSVSSIKDYKQGQTGVTSKKTECSARDFGAQKLQGIKINNIFEEPRKVTLRSQLKSVFSGGARSVVAMQIPAGSTDVAYSLRISTSQSDQSGDGQFCKNMDEKYKEIKFLGLPVYESKSSNTNIFREMLNSCEPNKEEEAYCNLYVFTSAAEAKKFSDGKPVSELKYNMDFSKQGTQSCNDRISVKGMRTIYFGFENTRMRYSVYLWLESLATVPTTEYFKTTYKATK